MFTLRYLLDKRRFNSKLVSGADVTLNGLYTLLRKTPSGDIRPLCARDNENGTVAVYGLFAGEISESHIVFHKIYVKASLNLAIRSGELLAEVIKAGGEINHYDKDLSVKRDSAGRLVSFGYAYLKTNFSTHPATRIFVDTF